ncbi:prolyl oligopeptidase family serine peptidase [Massilia sp. TS11]|uniref:S9 family peptidase n=1 Tax=Massilia sp. TS11 TaxID=2908003 RepID=UPI001EDA1046|nr:prolyl oligopeptidase family serine peptidase [Massilia sp. TS11]MCG2586038.1 prolyl oligopeptidase family serine peptidase [Massilia sp. TS11]
MRLYILTASLAIALGAQAATPISLDQAMAHPDWIGNPVEQAWWSWDGKQIFYKQKRSASPLRDTFVIEGGKTRQVTDAEAARLDSGNPIFNKEHTRAIVLRNGDLFERELNSGALVQVYKGAAGASAPQYSADGQAIQFRVGHDWYRWDRAERLLAPVALPRAAKDPAAAPEADSLRDMQLRLFETLKRQKAERDAQRDQAQAERRADPTRAPAPIYLGDKIDIAASALSPDGKYLAVLASPKGADRGRIGKMPRYVTESGYEEFDDERTRVGRNLPAPQTVKLIELASGTVREVPFSTLPGISEDPLAALRAEQKLPALKGERAVRGMGDASTFRWSADGSRLAVMLRAVDNKDRWIAQLDLAKASLTPLHRLSDKAWINWSFNEYGWMPDNKTLWYLSEESGHSHLYTLADGKARELTTGKWEASDVRWTHDGSTAYMLCNPKNPGIYEVCAVNSKDASLREVTRLEGVEDYILSHDERQLLVRYSSAYVPAQLASQPVTGGTVQKLTDTRTADYKARSWIEPQYVAVPSTHGAGVIWSKFYRPEKLEAGKKYPIVLFVHGAGYLQNGSRRYPNYFREQMFHNLLVERGYLVLDMDYRASAGYGRDWRTAIYRQMGHPELDDYLDGIKWLADTQQGDAKRVGVYGGSYGGFMSLIALLRAPESFVAGAALRPVTDWTSYNHEYTANILNTPDLDPTAYKISSPIEYADKLKGHLLIAHGMVDDNVFFQDSVRLAQRLIELKKDNWELAPYPVERHGFVQPESWYDEYRRILKLFDTTLK